MFDVSTTENSSSRLPFPAKRCSITVSTLRRVRLVKLPGRSPGRKARYVKRCRAYFELMNTVIPRVNPDPPAFVSKPFDFGFLTTREPANVGSAAEVAEWLRISLSVVP